MKRVQLSFIISLVVIFISSCVAEKMIPLEITKQVDTIITFDPVTFEETVLIVESNGEQMTKIIESYRIQVDTIISFDSDTYEETIQIVRTKVNSKNE